MEINLLWVQSFLLQHHVTFIFVPIINAQFHYLEKMETGVNAEYGDIDAACIEKA
jgi:hypothetical protein